MNKTKIALVGAGLIGQAHLKALAASGTAELCAIVDPSPKAAAFAAAQQVPHYTSLDALLTKAEAQGIILATPNSLHVSQALQCLAAGLPTLLEKPIAPTVAEAQTLVEAVAAGHTPLLIGHHRAHSPIMAKACAVIASGQLGRLVAVMGSATFLKPDHYFADGPWRTLKGGGPILLNMIHEVHNLRMLCGEIIAVQAFAANAVRGFAVEDTVAINLRFANGTLGSFLLSDTAACPRSWEQTSQENPDYPTYPDEDCYVLSGTHGSLSVPTLRLKTYPVEADRSWWKPFTEATVAMTRDDPIKLQMTHFEQVVRGEASPLVTARDGLNNLRVTEAITQAAASGHIVHLS
jgi:predicted dehydrogenase